MKPMLFTSHSLHSHRPSSKTTDIVVYIKPEFIALIIDRSKNHEYRKYRLEESIEHMWLLETGPNGKISIVITIGPAKTPGQVNDPSGLGNDDFDAGRKISKYGYPILGARQLKTPITRYEAKNQFNFIFPESRFYAPEWLINNFPLQDMRILF